MRCFVTNCPSATPALCREAGTAAALAAAGVDCNHGPLFDVSPGPSMLQTAMQRPGPLRELLAFGNAQQPQQQQQRPLPPPRPPQLQPEAQQVQLRAHADDAVMHPAAAPAEPQQPCLPASSSVAPAGNTPADRPGAGTAGPPEVSMYETGGRAVSPGIYSVAQHTNGASGQLGLSRPAANGGPALPGDDTATMACSGQPLVTMISFGLVCPVALCLDTSTPDLGGS